ncbi:MAG: hypothetical protein KBB01_01735 [Candidatus Omnitrophica bacterium]|jgi:hypothetical protein|nr:hypothetical protein [Candidatus Omnitrophota bacterium]
MKIIKFLGASFLLLAGCAPLLIGAGVVTGYALSSDTASGNIASEYRILWDVCLDTLETMEGDLIYTNESKGIIKARVSENNVAIKINSSGHNTQRLRVSARRMLMPKPQFAQKVFLKIAEGLQ